MDSVLRAAGMYFLLLVVLKIAGRRTLLEMNSFDFVLLLIISEATQQALLGNDFSFTGAAITIITLIVLDILLSYVKNAFPRLDLLLDGSPLILVENGRLLTARMKKAGISREDILSSARTSQGIERLEEIKFAILEKNGKISIIPADNQES
ncbi:DUF421 domain-containing protein [Cronobacter sakazakii]|uniref:YetF C-terminal domain-containing protein n=3 Tax=Cronobacter sakazakii TaxID=28141 RepID=A7MLV9_CROS8|nr:MULTISPECIES: YetF domain-containing protein [Cronobacter]EGL72633.1 hypothetical protein CSE899_10692 [Cronobacter sakazakii E899]ELY4599406.1 DUF421 domain-containing protein [Cronobacter malonaticus]MDK1223489.1 DUF421 domain-containing protein [Cronobacter turicensis]CCK13857.1 conserved hypothetical protein [Cronobacter sakazakii 680]ABU78146.1 hypothetical protein ESA_02917 [Cronobacter sakazakii ATCC BAA-894]